MLGGENDSALTLRHPVTTAQYELYLIATGYRPADRARWLLNWDWSAGAARPKLPAEARRQPVVFLGTSEARRYCGWRGLRLPASYEWQCELATLSPLPSTHLVLAACVPPSRYKSWLTYLCDAAAA